jgi:hypothetical protein
VALYSPCGRQQNRPLNCPENQPKIGLKISLKISLKIGPGIGPKSALKSAQNWPLNRQDQEIEGILGLNNQHCPPNCPRNRTKIISTLSQIHSKINQKLSSKLSQNLLNEDDFGSILRTKKTQNHPKIVSKSSPKSSQNHPQNHLKIGSWSERVWMGVDGRGWALQPSTAPQAVYFCLF